jgi:YfiH family protein
MLQQRKSDQGPVFYVSPLLEKLRIPHAFSTRVGGLSPAPFDSLNLGNPSGCDVQDDYERIYENYRLLQGAIGCADRSRCWVHQVHGGNIVRAMRGDGFESGAKADAIVGDDVEKILAVRVADCVPVLLAGDHGRIVSAVHSGWRGVIAGVVPNAIEAMRQCGCAVDSIVAAIGPCIGEDAFEVGPEVVEQFEQAFNDNVPARRTADGKGRVDLRRAVKMQLLRAGIDEDRIDTTDRCTHRDREEFFSHRRDNGITGRMAALIAPVRIAD